MQLCWSLGFVDRRGGWFPFKISDPVGRWLLEDRCSKKDRSKADAQSLLLNDCCFETAAGSKHQPWSD